MDKITIQMNLEKTTKNTYRFAEENKGKPPIIGTLYIQKWALGDSAPSSVTVIIESQSK